MIHNDHFLVGTTGVGNNAPESDKTQEIVVIARRYDRQYIVSGKCAPLSPVLVMRIHEGATCHDLCIRHLSGHFHKITCYSRVPPSNLAVGLARYCSFSGYIGLLALQAQSSIQNQDETTLVEQLPCILEDRVIHIVDELATYQFDEDHGWFEEVAVATTYHNGSLVRV
jgi:hypothetical protein